jgi:hypothetical protein
MCCVYWQSLSFFLAKFEAWHSWLDHTCSEKKWSHAKRKINNFCYKDKLVIQNTFLCKLLHFVQLISFLSCRKYIRIILVFCILEPWKIQQMRVIAIYTLYCGRKGSNLGFYEAIITRNFPQAINNIDTKLLYRCLAYLQLITELLCGLRLLWPLHLK